MNTKPRLSLLSCKSYYVTALSFSTNISYDRGKPIDMLWEDLQIESEAIKRKDDGTEWLVVLNIKQGIDASRNYPCNFSIQIVGNFELPNIQGGLSEPVEEFVYVNGSSILFGAARQILRNVTALGSNSTLLLPAVSFASPKEKHDEEKQNSVMELP